MYYEDFEGGTPRSWTINPPATIGTGAAKSGAYAVQLTISPPNSSPCKTSVPIGVTLQIPTHATTLTFAYAVAASNPYGTVHLGMGPAVAKLDWSKKVWVSPWSTAEADISALAGTTSTIALWIYDPGVEDVSVYIDDVTIHGDCTP